MATTTIPMGKLENKQSASITWTWRGGGSGWQYSGEKGLTGTTSGTIKLPEKYGKIKSGSLTYNYTFTAFTATFKEGKVKLTIPETNETLYDTTYTTTNGSAQTYSSVLDVNFINLINQNKPSSITCELSVKGTAYAPAIPSPPPSQGTEKHVIHSTNGTIENLTLTIEYSSGLIHYWNGSQWVEGELKYWNGTEWVDGAELKYWNGNEWKEVE